jgi:hypothetical protein
VKQKGVTLICNFLFLLVVIPMGFEPVLPA